MAAVELEELTVLSVERGLSLHDALGAHARDELGITDALRARPIQASLASAGSFCLGALFPVLMILLRPAGQIARVTAVMAVLWPFCVRCVGQPGSSLSNQLPYTGLGLRFPLALKP